MHQPVKLLIEHYPNRKRRKPELRVRICAVDGKPLDVEFVDFAYSGTKKHQVLVDEGDTLTIRFPQIVTIV
jgi:hypothetical protein